MILTNVICRLGSTRFFLAVLAACGAVSLGGIIIPQNAGYEDYAGRFGPAAADAVVRFGLDRIFSSPWFLLPLALLCVNLLVCIGRRLLSLAVSFRNPAFGRTVAAGSLLLHAGVLFLFAGALVQFYAGNPLTVVIREGRSEAAGAFGVRLYLRDFSILRNSRGETVNYRSAIEVRDAEDRPLSDGETMVNRPLRFRGLNLYQMTYGMAPDAVRDLRVVLRDTAGDTIFNRTLAPGTAVPVGRQDLAVRCADFQRDFYYDFGEKAIVSRSDRHDNPAFHISLFRKGVAVDSQWVFQRHPAMGGDFKICTAFIPSYTPLYFSGIIVKKNNGTSLIVTGFLCISIGMAAIFLSRFRRRR